MTDHGPEISRNDARFGWTDSKPRWLRDDEHIAMWRDAKEECPAGRDGRAGNYVGWEWKSFLAIRLPADHWAYAVPAGWKLWTGGDEAPGDYGGEVVHRDKDRFVAPADSGYCEDWTHTNNPGDIVAYQPLPLAQPQPDTPMIPNPALQPGSEVRIEGMGEYRHPQPDNAAISRATSPLPYDMAQTAFKEPDDAPADPVTVQAREILAAAYEGEWRQNMALAAVRTALLTAPASKVLVDQMTEEKARLHLAQFALHDVWQAGGLEAFRSLGLIVSTPSDLAFTAHLAAHPGAERATWDAAVAFAMGEAA